MHPAVLAACALVLVTACGGPVRSAVDFDGARRPCIAAPEQIREASAMPDDHEALGRLSADCRLRAGERRFDDAWLADVDCTERRLVRALRERASEVGGEVLVARRCESRRSSVEEGTVLVRCSARLARPNDAFLERRRHRQAPAPVASPLDYPLDEPRASEGWNILVSTTPREELPSRPDVPEAQVASHAELPVGHVLLGAVVTRCRACTERAARSGLRAAAGRLGGTGVVGASCVEEGEGWLCTARAAGLEDPGAR